jgi:hypothetical protein
MAADTGSPACQFETLPVTVIAKLWGATVILGPKYPREPAPYSQPLHQKEGSPGTVNSGCPQSASSHATCDVQFRSVFASSRPSEDLPVPLLPHTATTAPPPAAAACNSLLMRPAAWHWGATQEALMSDRFSKHGLGVALYRISMNHRALRHSCCHLMRHAAGARGRPALGGQNSRRTQ